MPSLRGQLSNAVALITPLATKVLTASNFISKIARNDAGLKSVSNARQSARNHLHPINFVHEIAVLSMI